jgi:hypothetical protein
VVKIDYGLILMKVKKYLWLILVNLYYFKGRSIRKLVKDGLIMKKAIVIHSRSRARRNLEEKRRGRHTGAGKRKGTLESRMPSKVLWMRR